MDDARDEPRPVQSNGSQRALERPQLPSDGQLIWMTPQGTLREIDHRELDGSGESPDTARDCPDCGTARSVRTVAREHSACGHVGLDGFVAAGNGAARSCPKCGAEDAPFPVVATVHSCVACGRVLDRPLGRR